jgi:hypothetical protein
MENNNTPATVTPPADKYLERSIQWMHLAIEAMYVLDNPLDCVLSERGKREFDRLNKIYNSLKDNIGRISHES